MLLHCPLELILSGIYQDPRHFRPRAVKCLLWWLILRYFVSINQRALQVLPVELNAQKFFGGKKMANFQKSKGTKFNCLELTDRCCPLHRRCSFVVSDTSRIFLPSICVSKTSQHTSRHHNMQGRRQVVFQSHLLKLRITLRHDKVGHLQGYRQALSLAISNLWWWYTCKLIRKLTIVFW